MADKKTTPQKKTSKKTAPKSAPDKNTLVDAAFDLIAKNGWSEFSFSALAHETGTKLNDIQALFQCKTDILRAYGQRLDNNVLKDCTYAPDEGTSHRDRIFDIMMERYEFMNEHRAAIVNILDSLPFDMVTALCLIPHGKQSMAWMLEAAGINTSGIAGKLRIKGLFAIHLYVLRKWKDDETPDLSVTMACLDQTLNRAEQLANTLGLAHEST